MSKEAFFELPSAEQKKKAEKYDVYKKYLKEGKSGAKKAVEKKPASKPAKKAIDKKTAQALKDEKERLEELTDRLNELKEELHFAKEDGDEETVDSLNQELQEVSDRMRSAKSNIKTLRKKAGMAPSENTGVDIEKLARSVGTFVDNKLKNVNTNLDVKDAAKSFIKDMFRGKLAGMQVADLLGVSADWRKPFTTAYRSFVPKAVTDDLQQSASKELDKYKQSQTAISNIDVKIEKLNEAINKAEKAGKSQSAIEKLENERSEYFSKKREYLYKLENASKLVEKAAKEYIKKHKQEIASAISKQMS